MDRVAFDDCLAGCSRRERAAFVAAILAARGWAVQADGAVVRATRDGERIVVGVVREGFGLGRALPDEPVDVVVGLDADRTRRLADDRDAAAWDAQSLYDRGRHGLDPAETDRLFRAHFGRSGAAVGRPNAPHGDAPSREATPDQDGSVATREPTGTGTGTGRTERWVISLAAAALVVVAGALIVPALTDPSPPDAGEPIDVQEGARVTSTSGGNGGAGDGSATTAPAATGTPQPDRLAPGVTSGGINDSGALGAAHAAMLDNRSFTMRLTYTESVDDERVGWAQEVVAVENGTVYRSTGTSHGNLTSDLVPVIVRDLYADGEGRYLRRGDDALRVGDADDPGTGQVVARSRALVTWYLSGTDSTVTGRHRSGDPSFQVAVGVTVEGTGVQRVEAYRAHGIVTQRGLVLRVMAQYRLSDSGRMVTVTLTHTGLDETTVSRPEWMPPRNATAK